MMAAIEGELDMAQVEIKLFLSDSVVREAEANGLLTPESIESLLRSEIRRRHVNQLFAAADKLAGLDELPMTEAEIEAEIQAVRNARRTPDASGG